MTLTGEAGFGVAESCSSGLWWFLKNDPSPAISAEDKVKRSLDSLKNPLVGRHALARSLIRLGTASP